VATIDRFLKPLAEHRAEELHIYAGVPPTYLQDQKTVRTLEQIFRNEEIQVFLKEIANEQQLQGLQSTGRLQMEYTSSQGVFRCQIRLSDSELRTRFTIKESFLNQHGLESAPPSGGAMLSPPPAHGSSGNHPVFGMPQAGEQIPMPTGKFMPPPALAASPALQAAVGAPARPAQAAPLAHAAPAEQEDAMRTTHERVIMNTLRTVDHQAPKEIDRLFKLMVRERASDLHISSGEKPMIRVDGRMRRIDHVPVLGAEQVAQLIAPIMPPRNLNEYTERWDTDFAYELDGTGRFRCNIFMDRLGIGAVFRLIPSEIVTAEQLGLSKAIMDLCYLSKGLVLVTGPTGSGKSTTLCALVDLINRTRDDHIITIEDPIEFVHSNKRCLINQREVGVHTKSFKNALRASLREDPDIVLVGELRDLETIAIAIETAETGHLVFGTLHTSSAVSTVDRMIDQFQGDRQNQIRRMLSNSLKAVISQTLLRRVAGGRIAAMEVLLVTHGVANLIREKKIHQIQSIMQTNRALGMQCLNDILLDYTKRNIVDVREAYTKAIDKLNFLDMLRENNIPTEALHAKTSEKDAFTG
jgi:twitching motility protein PilT